MPELSNLLRHKLAGYCLSWANPSGQQYKNIGETHLRRSLPMPGILKYCCPQSAPTLSEYVYYIVGIRTFALQLLKFALGASGRLGVH